MTDVFGSKPPDFRRLQTSKIESGGGSTGGTADFWQADAAQEADSRQGASESWATEEDEAPEPEQSWFQRGWNMMVEHKYEVAGLAVAVPLSVSVALTMLKSEKPRPNAKR
jgi:hypothetical protein